MSETIGEAIGDFKGAKDRGIFGGLSSVLTVLTPDHWKGAASGVADVAYRTPKALAYSGAYKSMKDEFFAPGPNYNGVIDATRAELANFLPETWGDVKSIFDTEIVKDILKPFTYGAGHAYYKVLLPLLSTLRHPVQLTGYISVVGGLIGMIPAIATGTLSMVTHLIPDLISFPLHAFGSINKTISGILRRGFAIAESVGANIPIFGKLNKATTGTFRRFFAAAEAMSEQVLVGSDLAERGLNKMFVPRGWREGKRSEHPYIAKWGQGIGGALATS
ncbi:MAG: hypothetical protein Q8P68_03545 [Candidatus Peregrinibacteria bacterium]|nr:hypothetical protein [Candidatus Peregrinibacteria bacterium]MDZ4245325.1 hypothetical protein [Candidatus Gracilibacteria bacterium]